MIRAWAIQWPLVVVRGQPDCAICDQYADDSRHLPLRECDPQDDGQGCPDPAAHHAYRAPTLLARRRSAEALEALRWW